MYLSRSRQSQEEKNAPYADPVITQPGLDERDQQPGDHDKDQNLDQSLTRPSAYVADLASGASQNRTTEPPTSP
jgi:hypothetical protein